MSLVSRVSTTFKLDALPNQPWWIRTLIAGLGGLLAGPALPHANLWPLIFVSVALIHLAVLGQRFWPAMATGFFAGAAFYATQSQWMSAYLGPEPWLALATLEGLIFGLGMALAAGAWRLIAAALDGRERLQSWLPPLSTIVLSLIWIAREWVACHFPYGGYQWSRLGQAVSFTPLANLAYFGGISLISLCVALLAIGATTWLIVTPRRFKGAYALLPGMTLVGLAIATPAFLVASGNQTLTVAAIQGNANAGLFANPVPGSILQKHLAETSTFISEHKDTRLGVMVWPENASDVSPLTNPLAANWLNGVVSQIKAPLLVGAVTQRGQDIFNSSLLFKPGTDKISIYDKERPVPFGEYVPDRPFWRSLAPQLIDLIYRGFTPGTHSGIFSLQQGKIGALICFEIGIDEIPHNLVTGGAKLIVSQANNSDFGHTAEAAQQETLVRLQAIATGRSIVHASTVATTEIVDPTGRILASTKAFTPDAALAIVPLRTNLTPAMRFFGWVDTLALWVSGIAGSGVIIGAAIWLVLRLNSGKSQPKKLNFLRAD